MCGGGGGPVTSFKVNFQGGGGSTYVIRGEGRPSFYHGDGVQLLSDSTYDLFWTPVPALDPRNYQEF